MTNDFPPLQRLLPAMGAMGLVILAANLLVEIPVQVTLGGIDFANWVTFGAISYPISFLVTDTTNRLYGAPAARRVVYTGFALGVILSLLLANPRIAIASGTAFLIAQLMDVYVFDRLRQMTWWKAPLASSALGSAVDTALFFSIAFYATPVPWPTLAMGDFVIKMAMATLLLPVFRGLMALIPGRGQAGTAAA